MDIGEVMGSRRCPMIPELLWFKTIFNWYQVGPTNSVPGRTYCRSYQVYSNWYQLPMYQVGPTTTYLGPGVIWENVAAWYQYCMRHHCGNLKFSGTAASIHGT